MSKVIMTDVSSGPHRDAEIKLTVGLNTSYDLCYDVVLELRKIYNPMFTFRLVFTQPAGYGINVYIPGNVSDRIDVIMEMGMDIQVLLNKQIADHG